MNQQYIKLEDSSQSGNYVEATIYTDVIGIRACNDKRLARNTYISYDDARKLVEMLVKHTHPGHSIEPSKPAKTPQLILAWQHPANGHRFTHVSSELVATQSAAELKRGQPDFPIWLAQLTKQYVQPNPVYEWKDL